MATGAPSCASEGAEQRGDGQGAAHCLIPHAEPGPCCSSLLLPGTDRFPFVASHEQQEGRVQHKLTAAQHVSADFKPHLTTCTCALDASDI